MKTMRTIIMTTFLLMVLTPGSGRLFAQGATVSGKVAFEGEAPAAKPINFGAERQCALMHGDKQPVNEELIVNPNKTVKGTLVYVKEGVTGTYYAPTTPVEIDQAGCMFSPHVSAAMVGQTVKFKNSDELLHNVRTVAKANKVFNIAQPVQGMSTDKVFDSTEIGIGLRCDVHFWMAAYIHVLPHPFFAITGDDGMFAIKDLPAGTYTIELWHEKLGTQTQTIMVADGETKAVDFSLKAA